MTSTMRRRAIARSAIGPQPSRRPMPSRPASMSPATPATRPPPSLRWSPTRTFCLACHDPAVDHHPDQGVQHLPPAGQSRGVPATTAQAEGGMRSRAWQWAWCCCSRPLPRLPAQEYLVRLDARAQGATYRGIRKDSIPASQVVTGPGGGPETPDGFAATCVPNRPAVCYFYRAGAPGAAVRSSPAPTSPPGVSASAASACTPMPASA